MFLFFWYVSGLVSHSRALSLRGISISSRLAKRVFGAVDVGVRLFEAVLWEFFSC